jgi:hypothetical protein
MASNPEPLIVTIVNAETGESLDREMTADEIANYQTVQQDNAKALAEAQAKADARESALAKLAALGLTQDEINAL